VETEDSEKDRRCLFQKRGFGIAQLACNNAGLQRGELVKPRDRRRFKPFVLLGRIGSASTFSVCDFDVMNARITSARLALSRDTTRAGRNFSPDRSVNGNLVRTTLPNLNIRVLDIGLAVQLRFVRKEIKGPAFLGHFCERQVGGERFYGDPDALMLQNSAAFNFLRKIANLDIFQNVAHGGF
jgi:hypothetical protein